MLTTSRCRQRMRQPFPEASDPQLIRNPSEAENTKERLNSRIPKESISALVPEAASESLPLIPLVVRENLHATMDPRTTLDGMYQPPAELLANNTTPSPDPRSLISQRNPSNNNLNTSAEGYRELQPMKVQHGSRNGHLHIQHEPAPSGHSYHNPELLPTQGLHTQSTDSTAQLRENITQVLPEGDIKENQQSAPDVENRQQAHDYMDDHQAATSDAQHSHVHNRGPSSDLQIASHPEPPAQSRLGNLISRPLKEEEIRLPNISDSTTLPANHSAKIKKSKGKQKDQASSSAHSAISHAAESRLRQDVSKPSQKYREFLSHGEGFFDELDKCEKQAEYIESQKAEIEKLKGSGAEFQSKITFLEEEKRELKEKMKKLKNASIKYHTHMNEVVNAQKILLLEAKYIHNGTEAVRKDAIEFADEIKKMKARPNEIAMRQATAVKDAAKQMKDIVEENKDIKVELVKSKYL